MRSLLGVADSDKVIVCDREHVAQLSDQADPVAEGDRGFVSPLPVNARVCRTASRNLRPRTPIVEPDLA